MIVTYKLRLTGLNCYVLTKMFLKYFLQCTMIITSLVCWFVCLFFFKMGFLKIYKIGLVSLIKKFCTKKILLFKDNGTVNSWGTIQGQKQCILNVHRLVCTGLSTGMMPHSKMFPQLRHVLSLCKQMYFSSKSVVLYL